MKIEVFETPFPYIRIYDFYTDGELELIWKELDFILNDNILKGPEKTGTAKSNGVVLKNNLGIFLDSFYSNRESSNILRVNRKIFEVLQGIFDQSNHWFLKNFVSNLDGTLISYYEDGGYYQKHSDGAAATCLTWFYKEPKSFDGGNLLFEDYNIEIEIENNSLIFFPSTIPHSVSKVSMDKKQSEEYMGRICMTQLLFLSVKE
jgi:Rps23 Pro-64 3,4-dihydroxylase Tpa1-like proline 4-hydroxylase